MSTQKNYVWNPTDYSKNSSNQYAWAKELFPKLHLNGNEALLDIGCGDGKITAELAKTLPNGKAVGIDNSAEMIKLAKNTFPNEAYQNLSFHSMDARNLTFNAEFDVAFSNAALHWIPDQRAVLQSVQRSLKPQGRLLFQMAGKGNAQEVMKVLEELIVLPKWKRYFDGFTFPYAFLTPQEYKQLLMQVGLKPLRLELFPREMKFLGAEGMAGWVRTTWMPFTERLPLDERESFVGEIVKRYLTGHPTDVESTIHLAMVRLEVEATAP